MSATEAPSTGARATAEQPDMPLASAHWRPEAFAADLPCGDPGPWSSSASWPVHALLQFALPAAVALVGGLAALVSVMS